MPIGAVTDTADFARFQDTKTILSDGSAPVYVALIQILTAYLAYIFGTSTLFEYSRGLVLLWCR